MLALERSTNRIRLGEFLRTRRERFSPSDFGLPPCGRRRTPGLRREEVAQLAGISVAYYTWIEQGRELNLSADILNSLARALRFTPAERTHAFTLAGLALADHPTPDEASTHPTIAYFLEYSPSCTIAYDPWFNVLGATSLAKAVFGLPRDGAGTNILDRLFTDPDQQHFWVEWESEARMLVGMLRQSLANWPSSPIGQNLLERLRNAPDFVRVWQDYDVRQQPSPDEYFREEPWRLCHPTAGTLKIHRIATAVPMPGSPTLVLSSPADHETCVKFEKLARAATRPQLVLVKAQTA